jgi:hypothetical protein
MKRLKARTRNGQTWTEAKFWAFLRSTLRKAYLRSGWKPAKEAIDRRSKKIGRLKYVQCQVCQQWTPLKEIKSHHVIPCGPLSRFEDIGPFCERLFCEDSNQFMALCEKCHASIHGKEAQK